MGVCLVYRWASAHAMVGLPVSAGQSALSASAVGPLVPLWVSIVSGSALRSSGLSVGLPTEGGEVVCAITIVASLTVSRAAVIGVVYSHIRGICSM